MKKYLFFLLTLVVASFAFISCSSDDDSDNGDYDKSMIVGTWEMTAVKTSESGTTLNTYVEGELFASYTIITATSTVSEMKMSIGDEAIWVKCKKQ